jgi:hypothetical protein
MLDFPCVDLILGISIEFVDLADLASRRQRLRPAIHHRIVDGGTPSATLALAPLASSPD